MQINQQFSSVSRTGYASIAVYPAMLKLHETDVNLAMAKYAFDIIKIYHRPWLKPACN